MFSSNVLQLIAAGDYITAVELFASENKISLSLAIVAIDGIY